MILATLKCRACKREIEIILSAGSVIGIHDYGAWCDWYEATDFASVILECGTPEQVEAIATGLARSY